MSGCKKLFVGILSAATVVGLSLSARAETGGGDSVQCGSSPGYWNVPNGASVASRTPSGVVANILGYLGEYYSHVMISHGATKMSHASMQTPRAYVYNSDGDHWYVDDIQKAGPGAATVNMGATYTYLYGQPEGAPEVVDYVDGGAGGATVANYLLDLPECSTITDGSCRVAIDDPQGERDIIGFRVAGVTYRHSYGVYTFVEDYGVHQGDHLASPYGAVQCSAFQAMMLNKAGVATITPFLYSNALVAPAAQGLYDIIYEFARSAGANTSTSANLADQLANCFVDYAECENQASTPWQDFVASGTASSVSPDRTRGIGSHGGANSPWTGPTQAVQWNQAGNVYGCWSEEWRTWLEPTPWTGTGGGGGGGGGGCTPDCSGEQCGQTDGCGGACPTTDIDTCGMCGNTACGGCESIMAANIGSSTALYYSLTGTDVTVALSGGTGDADLYVKLGSQPTTSSYDCRPYQSGNEESCAVSGTGTFYIMVKAYSTFSAATLSAQVASCGGGGGGGCTPDCGGDQCGQADGCGGVCPATDASRCGMCGNAACGGGCETLDLSNLGSSSDLRYTLTGTDVTVTLAGGSGDADLYVKLGSAPSTGSYDCRSWSNGNNESCTVSGTGTFHILVHPYSPFSGANLSADVASCDGGGGGCTPDCSGDQCGQLDGCGGVCPADDADTCGMCGNEACGGGGSTCPVMSYSTSSTGGASASNANTRAFPVLLDAGVTYTISTCASNPGDTYLRLYSGGSQVAYNDDGCASGYGSSMTYTPSASGELTIYGGCYNNTSCSGTIAVSPDALCP